MVNQVPAASPEAGEAADRMSARHGWLRFAATGRALPVRLTDDVSSWQQSLLRQHRDWYGEAAAPQVSGAFVLQYLLQVPAHTASAAAGGGMRVRDLTGLTFAIDGNGVPRQVELGDLETLDGDLDERLAVAERDYLEVAGERAGGYISTRPMSSRQRHGMVRDMWSEAARAVRSAAGRFAVDEPRRVSCCLIYALPGCTECSGCPRLSTRT